MAKLLNSWITIICEIIILLIGFSWYFESYEKEPLALIIIIGYEAINPHITFFE